MFERIKTWNRRRKERAKYSRLYHRSIHLRKTPGPALSDDEADFLAEYLCRHMKDAVLPDHFQAKLARKFKYGDVFIRKDGVLACTTCGGNCGQCGDTGFYGNVGFSMQHMIDHTFPHGSYLTHFSTPFSK